MSWSEKYLMWKQGINMEEISSTRQLFFKTKPTDEQIMILDLHEEHMNSGIMAVAILFFIIGVAVSYVGWLILHSMHLI
jgi:hypothetical protein